MLYTEIPSQRPNTPLLDRIDHPQQLRLLERSQLEQVADELRQFILYAAGQSGGHFGANLGVIELTVALHYCFNTPHDRLIWDVGHQAYPHKALTGRREQLVTIRSQGGLAAFPARDESEFDTFGVGHSSTAISAGLGMSLARRYQKDPCDVVAIAGDGAMTAGMAFEAMNDAVAHNADIIVVLNDNDMSISCSTGGFAKHLASIWESGQSVNISDEGEAYVQPHPEWTYNSRQHSAATDAADAEKALRPAPDPCLYQKRQGLCPGRSRSDQISRHQQNQRAGSSSDSAEIFRCVRPVAVRSGCAG